MVENGLNKREFSLQSGIPYMTIVNLFKNGAENIKLSTLKKIAAYFNVSLDYIAADDITERESNSATNSSCFTYDEIALIHAFQLANGDDKAMVNAALRKYY
jgi:transcriptional regulator with XRE-family HTH domain